MKGLEMESMPKKAMDPSRLYRFMDSPSTFNEESRHRPATHSGVIQRSWNGENCDMTPFARLDTRGKVILLENDSIRTTVLGTKPTFEPSLHIRSLEETILARAGPGQEGKSLVVVRPESVQNNATVDATALGYTFVASTQLQEGIMTPAQRRERLHFTTASEKATAIQKRGEMKERRLVQLMRHQYPAGVMGLDCPHNSQTQVYTQSAELLEKQRRHTDHQRDSRETNLRSKSTSISKLGYSYLQQDDSIKSPHVTKVCQEKIKFQTTYTDTHSRLFNETPPIWYPERTLGSTMKLSGVAPWMLGLIAVAAHDTSLEIGDNSYVVRLHASVADALRQINQRSAYDDVDVTTIPGEPMPMTTNNEKQYVCYVPEVAEVGDSVDEDVKQTRLEIVREISSKLRPNCVAQNDPSGTYLYEICNFKQIHRTEVNPDTKHPKIATRTQIGVFERDAEDKVLFDYEILKTAQNVPVPDVDLEGLLYTQYHGNVIVQFACADNVGQSIVGMHLPSDGSSKTAFLVGSRSFCLDKYAESAMDLDIDRFLKPLTSGKMCIKRTEGKKRKAKESSKALSGWWTYEVCFGNKISQYHREQTGEITSEFSLGEWSDAANEALRVNRKAILSEFMDGTHDKEQPAYDEVYDNGTPCDALDRTRTTRLMLFCPSIKSQPPYIISVQETSTCAYTIKVATPQICFHPYFAKEDQRLADLSQVIHCVPSEESTINESIPSTSPASKDEL
ncbi:hypothetical protein THRCLA_07645 [Thraustotheca clavata]|uniref:MRH domain-containing protein n=1 Tax=Thraustotheca clavata TaxID=74557 RepID=A0A1V9ZCG3_9STRA|nr:hypothetical protein THRCLA_07645 [Thraustotheca clavata]